MTSPRAPVGVSVAGIAARQSLNDLGPDVNARASADKQELWRRMKALEECLKDFEAKQVKP